MKEDLPPGGAAETVRALHAEYRTPLTILQSLVRDATGQEANTDSFVKIVRGYDNEVYRAATVAGAGVIIRIARHGEIYFVQEAWAIEQARRAGAPVPEVLLFEEQREIGETHRAVMVQRQIAGQPLADVWPLLSEPLRERVMAEAGAALRAIHSVSVGGFYRRQGVEKWDFETWNQLMTVSHRDRSAEAPYLRQAGFSDTDIAQGLALIERCRCYAPCPQPVLLHGDFHPAHLMVENGRLTGVIDFGEFQGGPPITDLAYLNMECPDIPLEWLRRGYGAADWWGDAFIIRLRLHQVGLMMGTLAYYVQEGMTEEAEPIVSRLRETLDFFSSAVGTG
jgi:aminoglycoside phosphotransferase (APT) family kinase protein